VATSLAVYWGEEMARRVRATDAARPVSASDYDRLLAAPLAPRERLTALAAASARLERDFGAWRTPWGEINRFQRLTNDVTPQFDDAAPSLMVPFTSAVWGIARVHRPARAAPPRGAATAPTGTASWRWSSSGRASGRRACSPAASAATRRRPTSPTRRRSTRAASSRTCCSTVRT
jgi:hypothetical protein